VSAIVLRGDARALPLPSGSVDAIVCDPPYGLEFMGREWDGWESAAAFQAWCKAWAYEALRVLKPGGHLLAFGAPRTYHRLVCGIEDAGFEIRDQIAWLYAQGFPKSLNIAKATARRYCGSPRL
jgi:site-specific DNA-methyltransferase (adenine-specific)